MSRLRRWGRGDLLVKRVPSRVIDLVPYLGRNRKLTWAELMVHTRRLYSVSSVSNRVLGGRLTVLLRYLSIPNVELLVKPMAA